MSLLLLLNEDVVPIPNLLAYTFQNNDNYNFQDGTNYDFN